MKYFLGFIFLSIQIFTECDSFYLRSWRSSFKTRNLLKVKALQIELNDVVITQDALRLNLVPSNETATFLNLVSLGNDWLKTLNLKDSNIDLLTESDGFQTVPGCLAKIKVKTIVNEENNTVKLVGLSDSKIGFGLLAFISKVLKINCNI
jgi:hypothetical protein